MADERPTLEYGHDPGFNLRRTMVGLATLAVGGAGLFWIVHRLRVLPPAPSTPPARVRVAPPAGPPSAQPTP